MHWEKQQEMVKERTRIIGWQMQSVKWQDNRTEQIEAQRQGSKKNTSSDFYQDICLLGLPPDLPPQTAFSLTTLSSKNHLFLLHSLALSFIILICYTLKQPA